MEELKYEIDDLIIQDNSYGRRIGYIKEICYFGLKDDFIIIVDPKFKYIEFKCYLSQHTFNLGQITLEEAYEQFPEKFI